MYLGHSAALYCGNNHLLADYDYNRDSAFSWRLLPSRLVDMPPAQIRLSRLRPAQTSGLIERLEQEPLGAFGDRLALMQAHERLCRETLRESFPRL